jgi:molybdenum cofactor sulfurtransferase
MPLSASLGDLNIAPRNKSQNSLVTRGSWKNVIRIFNSSHKSLFNSLYDGQNITADFEKIRQKHFRRLDETKTTYLDYTGGGLYSELLIKSQYEYLRHTVLGNPHSSNPTSLKATTDVFEATAATLSFFNADPEEYAVIFTANCSAALKIVGESFPFSTGSQYLTLTDAHNSVNGIGRFAQSKGAKWNVHALDEKHQGIIINSALLEKELEGQKPEKKTSQLEKEKKTNSSPKLFGLTGQSNATGQKHSLDWINIAQKHGWKVLLDMAALCPTTKVDLSVHKPDFACISFYKMFGYPTGVGALIAKKSALKILKKPVPFNPNIVVFWRNGKDGFSSK